MARPTPPEDNEVLGSPGDPESVARVICLRLLDQRARTRTELATALRRRGVPDDAAELVLDRFGAVGLIDDDALALNYALAAHRERGLAGRAVAATLRRRGVDEETVQRAVGQIEQDAEMATARAVARKRQRALAGLEPATQARRLVGLLARKGYSAEVAHRVVRDVIRESQAVELSLHEG